MVREIVKDMFFLSQKSVPAAKTDKQVVEDLLDTIKAHSDKCVGIAANMIGVNKTIMVIETRTGYEVIINPQIVDISCVEAEYQEGCLCHEGTRTALRRRGLTLVYYDKNWKKKKRTFEGFEAQIVQHELDHFDGIII